MLPVGPARTMFTDLIRMIDARLAHGSVMNARTATLENERRRRLLASAEQPELDVTALSLPA